LEVKLIRVVLLLLVLAVGLNACQGVVASIVSNPSALSIGKAVDSQTGLNSDMYGNPLLLDANNNLLLSENNVKIQPSMAWSIAQSFAVQYHSNPSFFGLEYEHDRFVYIFSVETNQTFTYSVGVPIVSNKLVFFVDAMTGDVINSNGCGIGPGTTLQTFNANSIQNNESINASMLQFSGPVIPEGDNFSQSLQENFSVKNRTIQTRIFNDGSNLYFDVFTPFNWTAVLLSDTPVEEMVSGFKKAVIFNGSVSVYSVNPSHMSVDFQSPSAIQSQVTSTGFEFSIPLSVLNLSKGEPFSVMLLAGDSQSNAFASFPSVEWLDSKQNISVTQEYSFPLHLTSNNNISGNTVNVTAFQWGYNPSTITVKQGDNVTLYLTSEDVTHGFELDAYGINTQITPGQITIVNFIADKPGTFTFYCSVFCGSGHSTMQGTLIVLPGNSTDSTSASNTGFFNFFNTILILAFAFAAALGLILIKKRRSLNV
jgi:cytochrome c oxidase subunit 2